MKRFRWSWARAVLAATALAVVLAPVVDTAAATPQRRSAWAITGATVITSPGNTLENATVVLRDGLIDAVGAGLAAPADARVIDGSGMTVYAGWIDAYSDLAIAEEENAAPALGAGRGQRGGRGGQQLQMLELGAPGVNRQVRPEYDVADHLTGDDSRTADHREAGFTAALVAPQEGIYRGRSVLIALREGEPEELVLRDDVTQTVGFSTGGFGRGYPSSAMGVVSLIRQVLLDTQRYSTWLNSFENDPRGLPRPEANPAYAALQPALAGSQQVMFDANNTRTATRGLNISREFGLTAIVKGNGNEYEMVDAIADAGVAVVVPVDYPDKPQVGGDDDANLDVSLADLRRWEQAPGNAAALASAGIDFAFTADGVSPGDFAANVRRAIEAGLSADDALAAVTTNPARMFGVDSIVGTIEPGKIANVVVASGAPFADGTEVRHVFIDGMHHEVSAAADSGAGADDGPVDPRGTWAVTFRNGDMAEAMTWRITGRPGAYSGSAETNDGSVPFESVSLEGNQLGLAMTGPMGQVDLVLTVSGDRLSGNYEIQGFSLDISGRRTSGPGQDGRLENGGQR